MPADNASKQSSSIAGSAAVAAAIAGLTGGAAAATTSCENESSNSPTRNIDVPPTPPAQDPLLPFPPTSHDPSLPFPITSLKHDTYNGVTLDVSHLPSSTTADPSEFEAMLSDALRIWTTEEKRGIWLRIPTNHANLIPAATSLGFDFQHAEPGTAILTKWLPLDTESRLPHGPTHQVGIGALVLHPTTGKMLAVQEKSGPAAVRKLWKMPTGLTDPGEDVAAAAVRELQEETGLECIFDRIVCIRQAHGGLFNRSDMFFVCLCTLAPKYEEELKLKGEIELVPQEEEILSAEWIEMEDYADQELWRESPLYQELNRAMFRAAGKDMRNMEGGVSEAAGEGEESDVFHGFIAKNLPAGFRPGSNTIYVSSKL